MIMNQETAKRKMSRMALEIIERNGRSAELLLLGIQGNGYAMAKQIQSLLTAEHIQAEVGELTIDKKDPVNASAPASLHADNRVILLIDDVANSGRTMMYALKPLMHARPKSIQTLALVERTYKQFPISLDYVGTSIATSAEEWIEVELKDGEMLEAYLRKD